MKKLIYAVALSVLLVGSAAASNTKTPAVNNAFSVDMLNDPAYTFMYDKRSKMVCIQFIRSMTCQRKELYPVKFMKALRAKLKANSKNR